MPDPGHTRRAGADERTRQTRGEARRQRILDTAVELLAARGFRGTSLAELAERVGMTHPGLLYYFGSKDRLLREVVAERERQEGVAYLAFFDDEDTSMFKVGDIARLMVANATFTRLYVVLAAENLDPGDPLHGFFVDRYERARRAGIGILRADQARGDIRPDVDIAQVSCEVTAMLMGIEVQWLMDPDRVDLIAVVDAYVEGLRTRLAPQGHRAGLVSPPTPP